jgi:hypothetical protein
MMMEANLLLGAGSLVAVIGVSAMAVGALVLYRKNGNGHHKPDPNSRLGDAELHRPLQDVPDWQLARDLAMKDLVERLDYLPVRMEQAFRHSLEEQRKEPEVPPEWSARMLTNLERIEERLAEPAWPKVVRDSLETVTQQLEVMNHQLRATPPPVPGLEDLIHGVQALVNVERKKAAKSAFRPVMPEKDDPVEAPPQEVVQTPPSEPPERVQRQPGPPTRAATPIFLEEFNLVDIPQDTVVEMLPIETNVFAVNVMNLGPGTVYLRENAEPVIDDPHATKLPPGTGDNGMRMPERLYALADVGGAEISVRLAL